MLCLTQISTLPILSQRFFGDQPESSRACLLFDRFGSIVVCQSNSFGPARAGVAQLVEQLICNHQVGGSSPFTGSSITTTDVTVYGNTNDSKNGVFHLVGLNVGLRKVDFERIYSALVLPTRSKNAGIEEPGEPARELVKGPECGSRLTTLWLSG